MALITPPVNPSNISSEITTKVPAFSVAGVPGTPVELVSPQTAPASLSQPLQPLCWPLTIIPGSGQFGNNASLENKVLNNEGANAVTAQVTAALVESGNTGNRLA